MKKFALVVGDKPYMDCHFELGRYIADNSISVLIRNCFGAIARITVCLGSSSTKGLNLANDSNFVDTNNCPWVVDFLESNGFGKRTGIFGESGYCEYPLMTFDIKKLQEYSEDFLDGGEMLRGGA